jgi:hypothetical protein
VAFSPHAAKKPENPGTSKLETGPQILRRPDDGVLGLSANLFIFQLLRRHPFRRCRIVCRTDPLKKNTHISDTCNMVLSSPG